MRHFLDDTGLVAASYSDDTVLPAGATGGLAEVWLPDDIPLSPVYEDFAGLPDPTPPIDDQTDPLDPTDLIPETPEPQVVGYRIPDLDAATARDVCGQTIEQCYAQAMEAIAGRWPPLVVATWEPKAKMAEAALAGDADAIAFVAGMVPDNEAEANGLANDDERAMFLAGRIEAKRQLYFAAIQQTERSRREAWAALAGIPDDSAALMAFAASVRAAAAARLEAFLAQEGGQ